MKCVKQDLCLCGLQGCASLVGNCAGGLPESLADGPKRIQQSNDTFILDTKQTTWN